MPTAPSLRELQHRLEAVWSLGGSPDLEAHLRAAAADLPVRSDDRLSGAERLGIYARMIFARIRDAIAEDFPATVAALGESSWASVVRDYLDARPTDHHDLRMAGRHLPAFLRTTAPPWVAELADLELALMESFTAAEATPLGVEAVRALAPGAWPELWLRPVPSLRRLHPATPSDAIRQRLLEGAPADPEREPGTPLRVWRRGVRVFHRRIDAFEAGALARLGTGVAFADLCEWIGTRAPHEDPATAAVHLLHSWLADEVLAQS